MTRLLAVLRHEWRRLRAVALVGLALWATVVIVSVTLGKARAGRAAESARQFIKVDEDQIAYYRQRAEAIERVRAGGSAEPVSLHPREFDWGPTQPLYVAAWVPMKVVVPPAPLSALAVGESEVRPSAYRLSLWNGELVPVVEPSANPLAVTLGRFDLALATVWLLPLLAIALAFDLSAAERDAGILPLVLSQPVSPRTLLNAKLLVRAIVLLAAVALPTMVAAFLARPDVARLAAWTTASLAYAMVWLSLCAVVDSLGRPASWNALVVAGAWILSTSVLPAAIQAAAAGLHPVAPRAAWAEEQRAFQAEREKNLDGLRADEKEDLIRKFLRNDPLYAEVRPATDTIGHYYMARAAQVAAWEQRRLGLEQRFAAPLRRQEELVAALRYLSPSALAYGALMDIAGAGRARYEHVLDEGAKYDAHYKDFLWPRMFGNATLASREFGEVPRFSLQEESFDDAWRRARSPLIGLVLISCSLLGVAQRSVGSSP